MKKNLIFSFIVLFLGLRIFSQNVADLSKIQPDNVSVLGGNLLCQPKRTSYGYISLGDSKNIYAWNDEGKILWQKYTGQKLKPFLSVGLKDMVYTVSKDSSVSMFNPGGVLLWKAQNDFDITEAPLCGHDGRIFVRGKNSICCYGLNGKKRWQKKIEHQNNSIPLSELNDGSILLFLDKTSEGKSVAHRADPFGNISEEIIFASKVISARSCKNGVLLLFSDGSLGLCSAGKNGAFSAWVLPSKFSNDAKIICEGINSSTACVLNGFPLKITWIDTKDGNILFTKETGFDSPKNIEYCDFIQHGLVVCSKKTGSCYSEDSKVQWISRFNPAKKWNWIYATDSGYISFCTSNWAIESYRMKMGTASKSSFQEIQVKNYLDFCSPTALETSNLMGAAISTQKAEEIKTAFSDENSEKKEEEWLPMIFAELNSLSLSFMKTDWNYHSEKSFYSKNLEYCDSILSLVSSCGVYLNTKTLASLIKNTKDPSLLLSLINCAGIIAFDPEGEMLSALNSLLRNRLSPKDEILLNAIAESSCRICIFMGRPAFFEQGKSMLTYMLYPQFSQKTKDSARNALNKILEIKL